MKNYSIWISIIAVIFSFAGGFLLANALNKAELEKAKVENARLANNTETSADQKSEINLSRDEINQKITDAEKHSDNFDYQKSLGIALYRYASMKNDTTVLPDAEKILLRANQLKTQDTDILTNLGNLNFDIGFNTKSNQRLDQAREFYQQILSRKPENYDVRTDLALTYYLKSPPENNNAIDELNKSLQIKPDNEKTLQFLIQAYLKEGKKKEAETALDKLKAINPTTPTLNEIATQLEQNESKTGK